MTIGARLWNGTEEEEETEASEERAVTGKDVGGGSHPVDAAVLVFVPERAVSLGRTSLQQVLSSISLFEIFYICT